MLLGGAPKQIGRLVKDMANLRQHRVPDPTLSPPSVPGSTSSAEGAWNGHSATPRSIVLWVRLLRRDTGGTPAAVSWAPSAYPDSHPDSLAAALVIDLIKASGGAPDPPLGAVLPARFFNLQSALLAARRLQWALEGLSQCDSGTTALLAIHSAAEAVAVPPALENLVPETSSGSILLSAGLAEMVRSLPGFSLRPVAGGHWSQLDWRSGDVPASQAADEQSVLGLIRALGREDPVPAPAELPQPEVALAAPAAVTGSTPSFATPPTLGRSVEDDETAPPFWKKPSVLVSAAAAFVILVVVLVMQLRGGHPKPDATTNPAPPVASEPVAPPVSAPVPPQVAPEVKPTPSSTKPPRGEPNPQPKVQAKTEAPTPRQPAGSCDLTEGEIPNSISRAQRLMYEGKLTEAQSAFQRLVGCSSARERALAGLQSVKLRMAAQ